MSSKVIFRLRLGRVVVVVVVVVVIVIGVVRSRVFVTVSHIVPLNIERSEASTGRPEQ
jgi:hypothetical protein